ncbi:MAG: BolA family transcriptional regulator [bacterium]|nr:BolA family transcriptional regulator [bacterium]
MINTVQIKKKIQQTFSPLFLDIQDESSMHAGHSGAIPGQVTHLRITLVADSFENISMIKQHRLINECLHEELNNGLHALALKTIKPSKWEATNG